MTPDFRWRNYVMRSGRAVDALWASLLAEKRRDVLYVLGLGFDERMCVGLQHFIAAGGEGTRDICLLTFDEGPESPSRAYLDLRDANEARLKDIVASRPGAVIKPRVVKLLTEGRRVGGRSIAAEFQGHKDVAAYTDVVVDVSALPRGLYFPLIAKLLSIFDQAAPDGVVRNLHAVVAHSPMLDAATQDEGIDESTTFLHGFSAAEFEREATRDQPRVWIPVLGHGQQPQLEQIVADVKPAEICPLLPSPAQNPREADELILAYRELLFDRQRVEPRNIIYASESNPFEVYRQIVRSVRHYHRALAPLGGCKAVVSAMSSKLASLGALLAAYELRNSSDHEHIDVGVAHVEAQGYSRSKPTNLPDPTLYTLWLCGESYEN